jgi:hypothetical protein
MRGAAKRTSGGHELFTDKPPNEATREGSVMLAIVFLLLMIMIIFKLRLLMVLVLRSYPSILEKGGFQRQNVRDHNVDTRK